MGRHGVDPIGIRQIAKERHEDELGGHAEWKPSQHGEDPVGFLVGCETLYWIFLVLAAEDMSKVKAGDEETW